MRKPYAIAVFCSDLHLSLNPPACRADGDDWLGVQERYFQELKAIAEEEQGRSKHKVPILCAGDIFDRWNPPPELINFALRALPDGMLCVPGQHDLPQHQRRLIDRCGYGVLARAGKIQDLSNGGRAFQKDIAVYGFGWEEPITPPELTYGEDLLHIALVHRYCWFGSNSYPNAPKSAHVTAYKKELKQYDLAVFGDNHKEFNTKIGPGCKVVNCGGFIRRRRDEQDRKPCVWVLYSNRSVKRRVLRSQKEDLFHQEKTEQEQDNPLVREFLEGLEGLEEQGVSFKDTVLRYLQNKKMSREEKEIILIALKQ